MWYRELGNAVGHQILAYGYEDGPQLVYVYDNETPDVELTIGVEGDEVVLRNADGAETGRHRGYFWYDVYDHHGAPAPPYHDLEITELTLDPATQIRMGGRLHLHAVVRNAGDYEAHMNELYVYVRGPDGSNRDEYFGGAEARTVLAPGESHPIDRVAEPFADTEGRWTVGVSFQDQHGWWRPLVPSGIGVRERQIDVVRRSPAPAAWPELAGPVTGDPATGINRDGRIEVFAVAPDGMLWHIWQTAPSNGWSQWAPMPAGNRLPDGVALAGTPLVLRNAHDDLEVFALGSNDEIWHMYETAGGWSGWESRGGPVLSPPSGGRNFDGRLQLFAQFRDNGAMRHAYQRVQGGLWSGWEHDYQLPMHGVPATATNVDGRLEVMVLGPDNRVYHTWQDHPGSDFGALEPMDGSEGAGQVATGSQDGRVLLWARGADGSLLCTNEGTNWPTWEQWSAPIRLLVGTTASSILDADGNSALCCVDERGHILVTQYGGGGWSPWHDLDGDAAGTPALSRNADGRLEVFVRGRNGMLQHRWQPW